MSGVKHTPGPWELVSLSGYGAPFSIRMPYIATTANVGQTHYGVQSVRRREDAILIAAAPDLLAAAQRVLAGLNARIDAADPSSVPVFHGIVDLHDAISRATGEDSPANEGEGR